MSSSDTEVYDDLYDDVSFSGYVYYMDEQQVLDRQARAAVIGCTIPDVKDVKDVKLAAPLKGRSHTRTATNTYLASQGSLGGVKVRHEQDVNYLSTLIAQGVCSREKGIPFYGLEK